MVDSLYIGRFAPSPTGPLHFGSLIAALGSWLAARSRRGQWLVRMEDLDPPREMPGAADRILVALERYGLTWDGPVLYQSRRHEAYREALRALEHIGRAYPCTCSRKEVAETLRRQGGQPGIYPGTCRARPRGSRHDEAIRVDTRGGVCQFRDRLQGEFRERLEERVGDFVIRRADGLFAYQLAVVVDDAAQGVTDVVRGSDLLDSTARQCYLQQLLGLPRPDYLHLPVAINPAGEKLSKQTHAPALPLDAPAPALWRALKFLGQQPPPEAREGPVEALLQWAVEHWSERRIPAAMALPDE